MTSKIVLLDIKDAIDIVDIVGSSIEIKSRKGVWFFNVDGEHHHIRSSDVNDIYINDDNLMFRKVLRFGDVSGEKDFWDELVIDSSQEYSFIELRRKVISRLQDNLMNFHLKGGKG